MQGNVSSITAVELFHRIRNRRIDRCIIGKDAGNAGDIKVIRISVFFILRNAAGKVLVKLLQIFQLSGFPEIALCHEVDVLIYHNPKGISQVVMLPVPDKQTFSFFVFPEKRCLVLIQRVHPVVCVDIHIQKLHAIFKQRIPLSKGNTVDIRTHCCFHCNTLVPAELHHFRKLLVQIPAVCQIVKIQIVC